MKISFVCTVEPVLSGHPRGITKRTLNGGDRTMGVRITLSKGGGGGGGVIFGTLTPLYTFTLYKLYYEN